LRLKRLCVFCLDIVLVTAAVFLSFLLRFDLAVPSEQMDSLREAVAVALLVKPLLFAASGMYHNIWRYASLHDAYKIFKAVTFSSFAAGFLLIYRDGPYAVPRSIHLLDWLILLFLICGSRLIWRACRETRSATSRRKGTRTFIVGAGEAGNLLLKEIRKLPDSPCDVVGFIDDAHDKQGLRLSGVPVLGGIRDLSGLVRKHRVDEVIFAIPSADAAVLRNIVASCERSKAKFKMLPGIASLIHTGVSVSQIKEVEIEDLLGRDPVTLDQTAISNYLSGKRVLVTGAAGSIGSEICRQVARFSPQKLILLDQAETPLFFIEKELSASFPELRILPVVGDVRNLDGVEKVFSDFRPEVVFHAAAYKHVAMMEYNPAEAVLNNVLGSKNVADASHKYHADNFVLVSTDKAVNPTNVMGASKRSAEIYVQALASRSKTTKFTTVRFGNVLGSNGSVIPLFKEQILKGGPVTVTHREVVRYFMTITEASQLVLQAGCIGKSGEIFVLDMGKPVRILALAEELIRLSGYIPYQEIPIEFTGLKPGEKLYEELLISGEGVRQTCHKKIRVIAAVERDLKRVTRELEELFDFAKERDIAELIRSLRRVVPEFEPRYDLAVPTSTVFKRLRPDLFPVRKLAVLRSLRANQW
jgi:FlaA1/EpsC-like NDP-sugar epimerase